MAPGRTAFSKEDDDLLIEWIATKNPEKSGRKGNELYKVLANSHHPLAQRHTWQSWRDRYQKHEDEFNIKIKRYLKNKQSERAVMPPEPKQEQKPSVQPEPTSSRPIQKKPLPLPPSDDYSGSIFPRDRVYEGKASKPLAKVQESEEDESQVDQMLTDPMLTEEDVLSSPEMKHTSSPLKKRRTSDQDSGFYESDSSISPARPILSRGGAPPKHVERPFGGHTLETTKAWPPSRKKRSRSPGSVRETRPLLSPKRRKLHDNRSDTPLSDSGSDGIYTPRKKELTITSPRSQQSYQTNEEEDSDHDPLFTQPNYESKDDSDESGEESPLFTQRPGQDTHTDDSEPESQSSPLFTPLSQAKISPQSKFSEPQSPLMRYSDSKTGVRQHDSSVIGSQAKHARQMDSQRRQPNSQRESLAQVESQGPLFTQAESQHNPLFTQVDSQRTRFFTQTRLQESSPSQSRVDRASQMALERGVEEAPPTDSPTPPSSRERSTKAVSSPRANSPPRKRARESSGNAAILRTRDTVSTQSRGKDQVPTHKSASLTHSDAPNSSLFTQTESQESPLFTQIDHRSKPFVASPDVFNPRPSRQGDSDIFVQGSSKDSISSTKHDTIAESAQIPRIDFRAEYLRSKSGSRRWSAMHDSRMKEKSPLRRSLPIWLANHRESSIPSVSQASSSHSISSRPIDKFSVTPLVSPSHPLLSHIPGTVVEPDEERQVIHALGVQTALQSYARDYEVPFNDLYAVYKAVGTVQAAKDFAQKRQIENKKQLEQFLLSVNNSKITPDTSRHSPSPKSSTRELTINLLSSSRQRFKIRSPNPAEEAKLEEEYTPPSKTRAGQMKRLSQQGRVEEALEREKQRASAINSGGRQEKTHTPVSKPETDQHPIWGKAEDEMLQTFEENAVAALQAKFGKDEVNRRSARLVEIITENFRKKGVGR